MRAPGGVPEFKRGVKVVSFRCEIERQAKQLRNAELFGPVVEIVVIQAILNLDQ